MFTIVSGLTFDEIAEGREIGFDQVISTAEIDAFATLSGDVSPLHMSDEFARSRGMPSRVAHGALLTAYASRLFGVHLPGRDCLLQSLSMRYLLPVHAGDRLRFATRVGQKAEAVRALTMDVTVTRSDGLVVARGKAQIGFTQEASAS